MTKTVEPAYRWAPPYAVTLGPEATEFAALAGLDLDPEQALILDDLYGVEPGSGSAGGRWAAFEAGVVCGRQNIKTTTFEAASLYDLYEIGDPLSIWSAHLYRTAVGSFVDIKDRIDNYDHLRRHVKSISTAKGDEAIQLLSGARLEFAARSRRSGRGLSGDKVTLDEAFELSAAQIGALMPIMSARRNPQVRYASSAGMLTSEVLRSIRNRGRVGGEKRLAWIEWCAPRVDCVDENCTHVIGSDGCALDDPVLLAQSNPALGRRLNLDFILNTERRAMTPVEFARERLGWWEDPPEGGSVFDLTSWAGLADSASTVPGRPAFAVDVTPDRAWCSIGVAGKRADGLMHVAVVEHRKGTGWAVPALKELATHGSVAVGAGSPAASLVPDLESAGVQVELVAGGEYVQACGQFYDAVIGSQVRHLDDVPLNTAVAAARQKSAGDAWKWARDGFADISPLVAVTLAAWQARDAESIYETRDMVVL